MPNALYENENYVVTVAPERNLTIERNTFSGAYVVTNKKTGIEEFFTPCLPEALRIAVHWDIAVSKEHHLWPYRHLDMDDDPISTTDLLQ